MPKKENQNNAIGLEKNLMGWLLFAVTIFLAVSFVFGGAMKIYQLNYNNKIYVGVTAGGIDFGGKTKAQAKALLVAKIDGLVDRGIDFEFRGAKKNLRQLAVANNGLEATQVLWLYNVDETVDNLYKVGRRGNYFETVKEQIKTALFGQEKEVAYRLKDKEAVKVLRGLWAPFESPGSDAQLIWENDKPEISKEKNGLIFDYEQALEKLKINLAKIDRQIIKLDLREDKPLVTKNEAERLLGRVKEIIAGASYILAFRLPDNYLGKKNLRQTEWLINKNKLKELLKIKIKSEEQGNKYLYVGVSEEKISAYLKEIGSMIEQPAKDARFKIEGEKVIEWQASEDGYAIDYQGALEQVEKALEEKSKRVESALILDKSKITNETVNDLGIKELMGTGESNFAGSPKNRRHNIAVGALALNGLLIKPEEELSLLQALGEINAESGYKTELVIREGKTVPEYGGGLCQIGTTMFRLAINTGLPIIERRNHSYRVVYYEPAGTDATIYDPWPDLKFKNDTSNYLLLQTKIDGDIATFDFFGTSDGRQVATTTPVIFNIIKPGEPKIIETDELKPGEKKKMESAHNGADAYFKRTIDWPEGSGKEKVEETWESHYVPWREVWLVGKVASTTEETTSELLPN